jgi:hypothetical protein
MKVHNQSVTLQACAVISVDLNAHNSVFLLHYHSSEVQIKQKGYWGRKGPGDKNCPLKHTTDLLFNEHVLHRALDIFCAKTCQLVSHLNHVTLSASVDINYSYDT